MTDMQPGSTSRPPGADAVAATGRRYLFASPISGASMNPARTLGPDIVAANFTGWWVYVFGDAIGALLAVGLIGLVRGLPDKAETVAAQGDTVPG